MRTPQFQATQSAQAMELIESLAWGDMEQAILCLEIALALALEATGDANRRWEAEGEERFGDEFKLSAEQVAELDHEWRLAYIARLLHDAAYGYGISPDVPPGRTNEGDPVTAPNSNSASTSPARLLRGLNDILYGVSPSVSGGDIS
jgi:hypothetical protein